MSKKIITKIGKLNYSEILDVSKIHYNLMRGVFSKLGNQDAPLTPGGPDTSPTGGFSINATHSHTINANTNSHGSESRPKNIAMMYIIKF